VRGSDLWYYRGESPHAAGSIGHEFIGIVEQAGADVRGISPGELVVAPFIYSDMTCPHCLNGSTISCLVGGGFGDGVIDGGQGEAVRVPLAGSTLVPVPGTGLPDAVLKSLLALSDVMSTGHHAAVMAGVKKGNTVAVVGDGAVGLCAVLASRRLGAERIIALSRHPARQQTAREFGAADIVEARGDEAVQAVLDLTGGIVGVPHGQVPFTATFFRNTGWRGGPAPARIYVPELLGDVLDGAINPGRIFDYETDLDHIADAYRAMDERRAIKSLVRVGSL
jgi:threonine dehydrogenase-like Zn-dependent dehydrogenase